MMVLIYGYSLLYILSGVMAYELNAIQVLGVGVACYLFDKIIFKTLRRFLTILTSVVITLGIVTYVLYRLEELEPILIQIYDFIKVYYLSVSVDTVSIDIFHQTILITVIGIALMRLLEKFININRWNYLYLIGISVILVVVGYLSKTMSSVKDQEAFMILCATMILYYFFNYYRKQSEDEKSFLPLASTVIAFIFIIVIGARVMYAIDDRPITTTKVRPSFQVSSDIASEVYELDKMSYYRQDSFAIQDSFEFNNIEVMKVRTDNMRYMKAETYEIYENGQWLRDDDLAYLDNDGDAIQKSDLFDQVNYHRFYTIENVDVTIRNINTNVLFMNNYGSSDTFFEEGLRIMFDPRRGIYFADQLLELGYTYNFDAVLPSYGDPYFDTLVRENSGNPVPVSIENYAVIPEEGYEELMALTLEVVDGIDNKYDQALAIEAYLKAHYIYTETPGPVPEGVDPVNHFLFTTGEGFCQQFSSAFILMTRSIGIPSRYATGFYVDIFEPDDYMDAFEEFEYAKDGISSVYDSDSHTWSESYFPEVGWIMFEATPGRNYRKNVIESPDFEAADLLANEDNGGLLKRIDWRYVYGLMGGLVLLMIVYGLYVLKSYRDNLREQTTVEKLKSIHRIIRYYYSRGRIRKRINETPREYAKRIDAELYGGDEVSMMSLMDDYERVVYGDDSISAEALANHIVYRKNARKMTKNSVNIFKYYRMRLYDFFNYASNGKGAEKATKA